MRLPLHLLLSPNLFTCGEEEQVDPLTIDNDGDGFSESDGDENADAPIWACELPENATTNASEYNDSEATWNNADGMVISIVDGLPG